MKASSPVEQPATQNLSSNDCALRKTEGMTSFATTRHVSGSRKKEVTLIRSLLRSVSTSSGSVRSREAYSSKEVARDECMPVVKKKK